MKRIQYGKMIKRTKETEDLQSCKRDHFFRNAPQTIEMRPTIAIPVNLHGLKHFSTYVSFAKMEKITNNYEAQKYYQ